MAMWKQSLRKAVGLLGLDRLAVGRCFGTNAPMKRRRAWRRRWPRNNGFACYAPPHGGALSVDDCRLSVRLSEEASDTGDAYVTPFRLQ